ncbi:hypothetical protein CAEBREN_03296 [Caenorhabditis brenneri]|uniref:Uncharacterized protein n=1 Tax=Caenorhabditis brenneri TaxID=135651 RepID=G0PIE9_CAEBE|nr:hypothetical protein CAEBREN_03296 [Caenorhabditis brenneri]
MFPKLFIFSSSTLDPQDEYAVQIYVVENDMDAMYEIFKSNRKLCASQQVKALSDDYEKMLEELTNTNICLDSCMKSNEARYMSHSCFTNCRATMVYSEWLNPAEIRMMMTSLLSIYTGLCKHLCRVKNVDLFPFIAKKHTVIIKVFTISDQELLQEASRRLPPVSTPITINNFLCYCYNQE